MKKFLIPIIAMIVGLLAGILYFQAIETGFFVKWKSLGIPPQRPVELTAFAYAKVYVKAVNDKYYSCNTAFSKYCWSEENLPISETVSVIKECQDSEITQRFLNRPNGNFIACKHVRQYVPEAYFEDYYIFEDNGEVWAWNFRSPSSSQSYFINLPLFTCVGTLSGLVFGLLFLYFLGKRNMQPGDESNDSSS